MQPQEAENSLKSCDLQRMTPLHCAAIFDHYALVDFLITQVSAIITMNVRVEAHAVINTSGSPSKLLEQGPTYSVTFSCNAQCMEDD